MLIQSTPNGGRSSRGGIRLAVYAVLFMYSALAATAQNTHPIPSGTQVSANGLTIEITALRDDILRVREGKDGHMPEDSSWAVVPSSRTASIAVVQDPHGFHTKDLRIAIDPDLRITVSDLNGHILQQDSQPIRYDGSSFRIYKKLDQNEHLFGLGDKVGPLDRRGMAFVDWNTDIGWSAWTDPIYKSIPFFMSWRQGRVLGVLFDNTWRASFDFGKQFADQYQFGSTDGPVDYYLMYGPSPKRVVEDYAWLTGPTPMPPLWSLGYQQSRFSYYPESRVFEIAHHLRSDKIPADVIYLDIDYQQDDRPFTVNRQRFPSFARMIEDLKQQKFHVVAITDLHIADLPNAGYQPFDEGIAEDRFVKVPDGKLFVGKVWPGNCVFPDFTEASTRTWWGSLYKQFIEGGIAGFWNDMNEPSAFNTPNKTMPSDVQHIIRGDEEFGFKYRVTDHLEIHNVYGMLQTEGTREGLLRFEPNVRPFVLTRASYAGGQRYAATWTGDNSSTWKHLQMTTPMLENLGLSGFALAGADVGGFRGSPQLNLLTKWMEVGAFQPIDRDHTSKETKHQEPWVVGPKREAIIRHYIDTRYQLLPYIYTTVKNMSETGLPIVRPLFLEFPDAAADRHPIDLDAPGEFMFGADLLIAAPTSFSEVDSYDALLPAGIWYDYWTGKRIDQTHYSWNGAHGREQSAKVTPITIAPTLDMLPVYARGGSVIPEQPLVQSTMQRPLGPLTLRVYLGNPDANRQTCSGDVYLDDGISYDYQQGGYLRMTTICTSRNGLTTVRIGSHEGNYKPWWHDIKLAVYGWQKSSPPIAIANGESLAVTKEHSQNAWILTIRDSGKGATIELH